MLEQPRALKLRAHPVTFEEGSGSSVVWAALPECTASQSIGGAIAPMVTSVSGLRKSCAITIPPWLLSVSERNRPGVLEDGKDARPTGRDIRGDGRQRLVVQAILIFQLGDECPGDSTEFEAFLTSGPEPDQTTDPGTVAHGFVQAKIAQLGRYDLTLFILYTPRKSTIRTTP